MGLFRTIIAGGFDAVDAVVAAVVEPKDTAVGLFGFVAEAAEAVDVEVEVVLVLEATGGVAPNETVAR